MTESKQRAQHPQQGSSQAVKGLPRRAKMRHRRSFSDETSRIFRGFSPRDHRIVPQSVQIIRHFCGIDWPIAPLPERVSSARRPPQTQAASTHASLFERASWLLCWLITRLFLADISPLSAKERAPEISGHPRRKGPGRPGSHGTSKIPSASLSARREFPQQIPSEFPQIPSAPMKKFFPQSNQVKRPPDVSGRPGRATGLMLPQLREFHPRIILSSASHRIEGWIAILFEVALAECRLVQLGTWHALAGFSNVQEGETARTLTGRRSLKLGQLGVRLARIIEISLAIIYPEKVTTAP